MTNTMETNIYFERMEHGLLPPRQVFEVFGGGSVYTKVMKANDGWIRPEDFPIKKKRERYRRNSERRRRERQSRLEEDVIGGSRDYYDEM